MRRRRSADTNAPARDAGVEPIRFPTITRIHAADAVIRRDIATDVQAGQDALTATENYNATVSQTVGPYANKVAGLMGTDFHDLGERMATGFRTWAENYYNKSQAYLFEGDLASHNTNLTVNPNKFAILGIDTDENPDMDIVTQPYVNQGSTQFPLWQPGPKSTRAVEVKASTSDRYASIDGLVANGMAQLRKREQTGRYQQLELQVHNDNPANTWPYTDNMVNTQFAGNVQNITQQQWSQRLNARLTAMKQTANIGLPVIVTASHDGQPYGQTNV